MKSRTFLSSSHQFEENSVFYTLPHIGKFPTFPWDHAEIAREEEQRKNQQLRDRLRQLGIDPDFMS